MYTIPLINSQDLVEMLPHPAVFCSLKGKDPGMLCAFTRPKPTVNCSPGSSGGGSLELYNPIHQAMHQAQLSLHPVCVLWAQSAWTSGGDEAFLDLLVFSPAVCSVCTISCSMCKWFWLPAKLFSPTWACPNICWVNMERGCFQREQTNWKELLGTDSCVSVAELLCCTSASAGAVLP